MSLRSWVWLLVLGSTLSASARNVFLVDPAANWHWRKGLSEASSPDPAAWRQPDFDDGDWDTGPAPLFYGEPLNGTELGDMRGGYTSAYLRAAFQVDDPSQLSLLRLQVLSDDGCIIWINGHEILRFNVPDGELPFDATALGTFAEPLPTETYDVKDIRSVLVPGRNVVAVHGFNASLSGSSDFVIEVSVEADLDEEPPVVAATLPQAGARVRDVRTVTVAFSEPVSGVDASDLLVNGHAATNVVDFGPDQYVFEFTPPPAGTVSFTWAADADIRDRSPAMNLFAGEGWQFTVDPDLPPPGLLISEFLASNDHSLRDQDGDASDWIEIANSSEETVNLSGWTLTDSQAAPKRWTFPAVSILPRGFLVVFASGKDRADAIHELHANFRLDRSGGYLALLRPNGVVASEFAPAYPPQFPDVSYGHLATDPLATGYFVTPTPGAANSEGGPGFAPGVRFSRIGGTYQSAFSLSLSTPDPMAVIRYTLDGSVPTDRSPIYTQPLTINASTAVRARSFVDGLLPGPLGAEYYVRLAPSAAGASSTLPLVVVDSFGGGFVPPDGEYPAFLSVYEPRGGSGSLTNAPDLRARCRLNIRGSSTLFQEKRNYSLELRDERDADVALSPLGMPADSDWVLYAPNNFEPILIHNPFIFRLSNEIGRYASRARFVELYITTEGGNLSSASYAGIYVLMEKIKRGSDRVDVARLEETQVDPPEVTGGYLLKIDRLDPGDSGLDAGGQSIGFIYPKEEEMDLPQRAPQRTYIRNYIDAFRDALYSANWQDPVLGWRPYVDVDSWIDHHILNVMAFNVDALRLSAFFYKPRELPLHFGPLWDFDRALNSTDGRDSNPRVWRSRTSDLGTDFFNYPWWGRLFRDPDFWQRWIDRYEELRRDSFSTNHLFALIDALTDEVRPAQPREVARWSGFTSPRGSYQNEINSLKTWLTRRLEFMDTNFLAAPVLTPSPGPAPTDGSVQITAPAGATVYYTLDGTDPRAAGGDIAPGARVYSGPIAVGTGARIRARARDDAHKNLTGANNPPISSPWSGLAEGLYTSDEPTTAGDLQITEIQYRPAPPDATELAGNPVLTRADFEFLELRNAGPRRIDLRNLHFAAGVVFDFATSNVPVLEAGARVVLVRNRQAFTLRYGPREGIAGEYGGGLDADGEALRVEDTLGSVILEFFYEDGWCPSTDGSGFSMVRRDESVPIEPGSEREAWRASSLAGGSPGEADPEPVAVPAVVVNEVLSHAAPSQEEGVELHNPTSEEADIGGWWLTDDRHAPAKYRILDGTRIPPGGYLWIDAGAFSENADPNAAFALGARGDAIWLFAASPTGTLLGYAHGFSFGAASAGVSFGREIACDGTEAFVAQREFTPGRANSLGGASAVLISELNYHPPDIPLGLDSINDTALEFIELVNVSDHSAPLFDSGHPTNTWRLRQAVSYVFPAGVTLASGERVLIVNFDPEINPQARARFLASFPQAGGIRLFGPYSASLPNSKATVELAQPVVFEAESASETDDGALIAVDTVTYDDRAPWPLAADGGGFTLQRLAFSGLGNHPRAWMAAAPSPGLLPPTNGDEDGDHLPDAWEMTNCLDPNDAADAALDSDGDGASNLSEFLAGTAPLDPRDVLRWVSAVKETDRVELHFEAKPGIAYVVEVCDTLGNGNWQTLTEVGPQAQGGPITVLDPSPAPTERYYRLRVGP